MHLLRSVAREALPDTIKRGLHRRLIHRQIKAFESRTITRRYAGEELRVSLQDPLAEGWYDHDWGPQGEIDMLRRGRLKPGSRVFDLGAHQAVVALILARIVGESGEVVAVEAERHNVAVAQENVRLNGASNLRVIHAAAADRPGQLLFVESLNGSVQPGGRSGKVQVAAVTVDGLAEQFGIPDVVFIDVEGYELKVLAGASRTLRAGATDFFVEIHDAEALAQVGATADKVVAVLAASGYECRAARASGALSDAWEGIDDGSWFGGRRGFLIATAPG